MEEKVNVEPFQFRGDGGTLICYEDIVLWRDVVFLVWNRPYSEDEQSGGAPASITYHYTGYLRKRDGSYFTMTYFSNVVVGGHPAIVEGTGILLDGGVGSQPMTYDEKSMKFWKVGEQYAAGQGTSV